GSLGLRPASHGLPFGPAISDYGGPASRHPSHRGGVSVALRLARRGARSGAKAARVDRRTKNLLRRIQPGEVAVIDHEDLDRVSAEGLVEKGVAAVVDAAASISGRYPNLGPLILVEQGVPLIDGVGHLVMSKIREGDAVRIEGDRLYLDGRVAAVGVRQTRESITAEMEVARRRLADQFES